jgi:hypothetical protein
MRLKADCLLEAGVIDAEDWLSVYARTAAVLGFNELDRSLHPPPNSPQPLPKSMS